MAKVEYVYIVPGLESGYFKVLQSGDRFAHSRMTRKIALYSKKRVKGITARSLLPQIAAAWELLSVEEKAAWSLAGAETNLNGWRLFVQDMSARIKNEMPGVVVPSLLHQSWVGNLHIGDLADEIKIAQLHPRFYWISRKVTGKKGMYQPVLITEDLALPVTISLNYKSDLDCPLFGDANFGVYNFGAYVLKFYAQFWYSYQGVNLLENLGIELDLLSDWKYSEATLTSLRGYVVGYSLFFHLEGVQGELYFDDVKSVHSGQNWVRDPFCKDINQGFTRAFYQVPKHWAGVVVPVGSWYDSIYKDF